MWNRQLIATNTILISSDQGGLDCIAFQLLINRINTLLIDLEFQLLLLLKSEALLLKQPLKATLSDNSIHLTVNGEDKPVHYAVMLCRNGLKYFLHKCIKIRVKMTTFNPLNTTIIIKYHKQSKNKT